MTLIEKIKLLFAVRKPAFELVSEIKTMKAGYKTVPFWVSVLGTLGSIVAAITGLIPSATALLITTILGVCYNVLRSVENANAEGVKPLFQSTRFWVGVLAIVAAGIEKLVGSGFDSEWLITANTILAAVMAGAQSIGANQPNPEDKPEVPAPTK